MNTHEKRQEKDQADHDSQDQQDGQDHGDRSYPGLRLPALSAQQPDQTVRDGRQEVTDHRADDDRCENGLDNAPDAGKEALGPKQEQAQGKRHCDGDRGINADLQIFGIDPVFYALYRPFGRGAPFFGRFILHYTHILVLL